MSLGVFVWRLWMALVDATLISIGAWWLAHVWAPVSVLWILLTVIWVGEFATRMPDSPRKPPTDGRGPIPDHWRRGKSVGSP